ncbi:hypothetical protein ACFLT9_10775 [Acidobacteriota bacterium]
MANCYKAIRVGFLILFLFSCFPASAELVQTGRSGVYAKDKLVILPSEDFGTRVDWDTFFYNTFTDLTVGPEGNIFAASSRQHKIFKFSSQGDLIKSFGEKGQGPGDFNGPDNLSILDNKFLVIGEYALSLRISLFDLDGNFFKVLKTKNSVYSPIALKNNHVAYIGKNFRKQGNTTIAIESAIIKRVDNGEESTVVKFEFPIQSLRTGNQSSISLGDDTGGRMFIACSGEGNLLVGNSLLPKIDVYTIEGKKVGSITLNMETIPVTKKLISRFKEYNIELMSKDSQHSKARREETLKTFRKASWDHLFSTNLPFYTELLVDSSGHMLLFRKLDCLGECPVLIQAYSPQGEYISQFELQGGDYSLIIDPRRKHMCFTGDRLIALVQKKNSPEFSLRLIEVQF